VRDNRPEGFRDFLPQSFFPCQLRFEGFHGKALIAPPKPFFVAFGKIIRQFSQIVKKIAWLGWRRGPLVQLVSDAVQIVTELLAHVLACAGRFTGLAAWKLLRWGRLFLRFFIHRGRHLRRGLRGRLGRRELQGLWAPWRSRLQRILGL